MKSSPPTSKKNAMLHQKGLYKLGETLRDRVGADAYKNLFPHFHLLRGSARKTIPELAVALQADLVIMGTVARTGISGLIIGNTAEAILDQLTCSVLAIKPPGFITPVKLAG
ncbi:MAG: universal stress protein [Anaerolineae bacterium]|nr:universal stress protein [Anaerolineae bacterium]